MSERINIGTFDRQIVIQSKTVVKDSFGHPDDTYATVATVFAARTWPEIEESNALTGTNITERVDYTIHAQEGINAGMQVTDDGKTYRVLGINYLNKLFMVLKCEKA